MALIYRLPRPLIARNGDRYFWDYRCERRIGMIRAFYGNIVLVVRTFMYIAMLGPQDLREVAEVSVINTNYFIKRLMEKPYYELPYVPERPRKHEVVVSASKIARDTGVTAEDIAKALLDEGLHAPTMYFPLMVGEALMVEFAEAEPREVIDAYAEALNRMVEGAYRDPQSVRSSPRNTSVSRLDLVRANHPKTVVPSYRI